jgi:hypothetical protein
VALPDQLFGKAIDHIAEASHFCNRGELRTQVNDMHEMASYVKLNFTIAKGEFS